MSTAPTRGTRTRRQFLPTTAFAAPLDMVKVDGKIYAVPVYVSGVFFFYNKELLQSNNLTPPRTWDELLSFIEAAKGKGLIPIGLANKTRWPGAFYLNYLVDRINGGDFLSKALVGQASFTDPGVGELQTSSYPATTRGAADRGGGPGRRSTGPPGGGRRAGRRGHQHRASFRADSIWCPSGGPGTRPRPARRRTQQQAVTRMAGVRSPPPTV